MNGRPRKEPRRGWHMQGWFPIAIVGLPSEVETLAQYLQESLAFVSRREATFRAEIDRHVRSAGLLDDQADAFYESREDDLARWSAGFPNLITSTTLVSACSALESALMSICKDIEKQSKKDIEKQDKIEIVKGWRDFDRDKARPTGRFRAAAFLNVNVGIDVAQERLWGEFNDYFTLRDCVVHTQGAIDDVRNPGALRQVIRRLRHQGVREGTCGELVVDEKFVRIVLENTQRFWELLTTAFIENAELGPRHWP